MFKMSSFLLLRDPAVADGLATVHFSGVLAVDRVSAVAAFPTAVDVT
jgi:hypothetical protein